MAMNHSDEENSEWTNEHLHEALSRTRNRPSLGVKLIRWGYAHVAKPYIFHLEPDRAHDFTVQTCARLAKSNALMGLLHSVTDSADPRLERDVMGVHYMNPFGLSAGLDKDADLLRILDAAGYGFCSYGSMTAEPCEGNKRPWFHRLPEYKSLLIHAGLPNRGAKTVMEKADSTDTPYGAVRHASVGFTNRKYTGGVPEMIEDYVRSVKMNMDSESDVCEVNISCPNLAEGKPFQDPKALDDLFSALDEVTPDIKDRKPVLVKMPSVSTADLDRLLEVLAVHDVQGVATCNLLEDRTGYEVPDDWEGSLSGRPCNRRAVDAVRFTREKYGHRFAIEGIGGVFDDGDALTMLDAGADLVGFVTTLMFNGPQRTAEFKYAMMAAYSQLEKEHWEAKGVDYERPDNTVDFNEIDEINESMDDDVKLD